MLLNLFDAIFCTIVVVVGLVEITKFDNAKLTAKCGNENNFCQSVECFCSFFVQKV